MQEPDVFRQRIKYCNQENAVALEMIANGKLFQFFFFYCDFICTFVGVITNG